MDTACCCSYGDLETDSLCVVSHEAAGRYCHMLLLLLLLSLQWAKLTEAMGEVTAALEAKAGGASLPPGGAARSQQARKAAAQPVAGQPAPAGQSVAPALPAAGGEAGQANVDLGGKKRAVADLFKSKAFISLREYYEVRHNY